MANHAYRTTTPQQSPAPTSASTLFRQLHKASEPAAPAMPLRYGGGDLGLASDGEEPLIVIADNTGTRWTTHSVEWVLSNISHFTPRCQLQILADAAMYFGVAVSDFVRADFEPDSLAVNARPAVMWPALLALEVNTSASKVDGRPIWCTTAAKIGGAA